MNRRDAIASLLAITSASAVAACSKTIAEGGTADVGIDFAADGAFFSADEMARLSALAETIIPETDTAGAIRAGVPGVIQGLASDWGDDDYRRYMRGGLSALSDTLRKASGQSFAGMSAKLRESALAAYDRKVYAGEIEDGFYRDLKRLVASAYYMSEPGASEELAYEAVPGEWIGDAPVSDYPKTWAT